MVTDKYNVHNLTKIYMEKYNYYRDIKDPNYCL